MKINSRLRIFNKILNSFDSKKYYYLFVFHLSQNNHKYLKVWLEKKRGLGVISIPYSEVPSVLTSIESITRVYRPKLENIPQTIQDICSANSDKKIILVEIGGYSATVSNKLNNIILAVEDTNQGHWNFEQNIDKLSYPVVSMAQAELKNLENHLIGESIVYSVQTLLRDHFNFDYILGKKILVLSYGGIGSAVCKTLQSLKAQVGVYDINPIRQTQAYVEGFRVVDKNKALKNADIIIGCTGKESLAPKDIQVIKNRAILISGSSKQIEFPYEHIKRYVIANHRNEIEEIQYGNKHFYIAYKGQPINFLHDSSLGDIFDLQMSLLCSCVKFGLKKKLQPGIYTIPPEEQKVLAEMYLSDKRYML